MGDDGLNRRWRAWVEREISGPEPMLDAATAAAVAAAVQSQPVDNVIAAAREAALAWSKAHEEPATDGSVAPQPQQVARFEAISPSGRISSPAGGPFSFWVWVAGAILMAFAVFSVRISGIDRVEDAGLFAWGIALILQRLERQWTAGSGELLSFALLAAAGIFMGLAAFSTASTGTRWVDAGLFSWSIALVICWVLEARGERTRIAWLFSWATKVPGTSQRADLEAQERPERARLEELLRLLPGLALVAGAIFMGAAVFKVPMDGIHRVDAGLFSWGIAWVLERLAWPRREAPGGLGSLSLIVAGTILMGLAVLSDPIRGIDSGLLAWGIAWVALRLERPLYVSGTFMGPGAAAASG